MNLEEKREKVRAPYWEKLEEFVGGDLGKNIVKESKDLYSIYSADVIDWFVGLYDVESGAYYYSNSARDNEFVEWRGNTYCLLPDAESTSQALSFIDGSGMTHNHGGKYKNIVPKWMIENAASFMRGIQDPNGFFYHPQWGKEAVDKQLNRRARDLVFCCNFLKEHGYSPIYDTPNGMKGERSAVADPNAAAPAPKPTTEIPAHLVDKNAFISYLGTLDMRHQSYHSGNMLATQMSQIGRRDAQLKEEGADYSLYDILIEWLNSQLFSETGLWEPEVTYYSVNGLLKTGSLYNAHGVKFPYIEAAAQSIIDDITSPEPMSGIVDVFNAWWICSSLNYNLNHFHEDGAERIEKIRKRILANAPAMIRVSKEKVIPFKKEGGCYSYCRDMSSPTSQDMPVAIYGSPEGDINGNGIAMNGYRNRIFGALGLGEFLPPLLIEDDAQRYMQMLEDKRNAFLGKK